MYDWIKSSINTVDGHVYYNFDCRTDEEVNVSALQASHMAIKKITEDYPPPYTLYVSGGVDSQAMLYAWHTSKVKYNTFSAKYKWGFNDHDLENLELFSAQYKIPVKYVNVDIIKFWENEYDHYANTYYCASNQITAYMKLASLTTEGTVIMSGELMNRFNSPSFPDHENMGLYHYRNKTKTNFIPFFFLYTKELTHSFKFPYPKQIVSEYSQIHENNKFRTSSRYKLKTLLYQQNGFPIIPQVIKYNGFEKIKDYFDEHNTVDINPLQRLNKGRYGSRRIFDILYRNNFESRFQNHHYNWLI